jgi:hypothetical protein
MQYNLQDVYFNESESENEDIYIFSINESKNENKETNKQKGANYPEIKTDYIFIQDNTFPHRESEQIEFKDKKLTDAELSKIFSGFSNTSGGVLYIGIGDDRKINGRKLNDKQLDEFKLFVDNVQQNYVFPPITEVKINVFPVFTQNLTHVLETFVIKIDIPKLNEDVVSMDGIKYTRYNASFRAEGVKTFVRIGDYNSIQDKYKNEIAKNKILKKDLDDANKKYNTQEKQKKILEEKIKENNQNKNKIKTFEEKIRELEEENDNLRTKIKNYDFIFGEYDLTKKKSKN